MTQLERDSLSVLRYFPRSGQLGLEFLGQPVDSNQHAAGQITYGLGSLVLHRQRVKRFRVGANAEAQFAAPLREEGGRRKDQKRKNSFHETNSFSGSSIWK